MCGIGGYLGSFPRDSRCGLDQIVSVILHRGPDDSGQWADDSAGIGLAHRRLAVIDLSPAGHQPMTRGDLVIVFNGEIYNYQELRRDLEASGCQFVGDSDTEVLLALIERNGLTQALSRCHGMFALALWDRRERVLSFARDRFGEKPLYYGVFGDTLLFGSELAALKAHPAWRGRINPDSLALYFRHNCVPQPLSIYVGVEQVRPGHIVCARLENGRPTLRQFAYWDAEAEWQAGLSSSSVSPPEQLVDEFIQRAGNVVERQMVSDVPLGAFLSGGIDSSLVVSLMQSRASAPVRTFTIGFAEDAFNEAAYARRVAEHLGTEHTEVMLSVEEARDLIPDLAGIYGEPFADSSQLPSLLVSRITRDSVTVALSGDGGDEFYGGYGRYLSGLNQWGRLSRRPLALRRAAWRAARSAPDRLISAVGVLGGGAWDIASGAGAAMRVADRLSRDTAASLQEYYLNTVSFWDRRSGLVRSDGAVADREPALAALMGEGADALRWMMFRDSQTYMNDDILTKVDRASMHYSLETRAPFLDHELAAFAWRVPTGFIFMTAGANGCCARRSAAFCLRN